MSENEKLISSLLLSPFDFDGSRRPILDVFNENATFYSDLRQLLSEDSLSKVKHHTPAATSVSVNPKRGDYNLVQRLEVIFETTFSDERNISSMHMLENDDVTVLASHCLYMLEYYGNIPYSFREQRKLVLVLKTINQYTDFLPSANKQKKKTRFLNMCLSDSIRFQTLLCKFMEVCPENLDKVQFYSAKCLMNVVKFYYYKLDNVNKILNESSLLSIGKCIEVMCDKVVRHKRETFVQVHFFETLISLIHAHYIKHEVQECLGTTDEYLFRQLLKVPLCCNQLAICKKTLAILSSFAERCNIKDIELKEEDIQTFISVSVNLTSISS